MSSGAISASFPEPRSIEGAMRHLAAAQESLDYERMEVLEILEAGPWVVAVSRVHAVGRASGVPVERDAVHVFRSPPRFRAGWRCCRWRRSSLPPLSGDSSSRRA